MALKTKKQISDTKLQEKLGFIPHKKQQEIIECNSRIRVVCGGKRGGKTLVASYEVIKEALSPDKRIWIVAPSYLLAQIIFDQVIIFLTKIVDKKFYSLTKRPIPQIELANGSIIECKSSANPHGMMGRALDLIVIDEAARVEPDVWKRFLRPNIVDRKGKAILISTPAGKNWFYEMWINAGKGKFHFTSLDNPHFPQEEWDEIKATTPQRIFEQEYEAKFITASGQVFRGIEKIIEGDMIQPEQGHSYVMGVDLGKYNDFTVLVVMDRFLRKMVWMDRFNKIDYSFQKQKIITLAKKYNAKIIIDSSGQGDPVAEDISREIFTEKVSLHNAKTKQQLIEKLSIFIEQQLITIIPNETLIKELEQYGFTYGITGYTKYAAPGGDNYFDDCVIALALAVWGLRANDYIPDDTPSKIKIFNEYL